MRRPVLVESAHGHRKNRSWKTMGDDEVAGVINAFIAEHGITSIHGLRDQNDYMAVLVGKRGIRDMIVFCPGGRRNAGRNGLPAMQDPMPRKRAPRQLPPFRFHPRAIRDLMMGKSSRLRRKRSRSSASGTWKTCIGNSENSMSW